MNFKYIIFSVVLIACIIYFVGVTYSAGNYTIRFNRAEGTQLMKTCKTDESGKINDECMSVIKTICNKWSTEKYYGDNVQDNATNVSNFTSKVFTSDMDYYCVANSSLPTADSIGCYVCKNNSNIMKWHTNNNADSNCSAGYNFVNKSESECITIVQDSCYVCKNNSNIMKWDTNGNADSNCSSGYNSINKPKSECITIVPEEKETIENPETGKIMIYFVWIIGVSSICYAIYYYKSIKNNS